MHFTEFNTGCREWKQFFSLCMYLHSVLNGCAAVFTFDAESIPDDFQTQLKTKALSKTLADVSASRETVVRCEVHFEYF